MPLKETPHLNATQISEVEMREALGLGLAPAAQSPAAAPQEKAKRSTLYTLVELSVRQKAGGPAFRFEYRSRSISTLTARLEAEKAVRQQGLEVWAVLEIRQVNE
jgi:hypothetical protein